MEVNKSFVKEILEGEGTYREKYYKIYGENVTKDKARHRLQKLYQTVILGDSFEEPIKDIKAKLSTIADRIDSKNNINIHVDGSQSSEKLIECTTEDLKNPSFLLKTHGYDEKEFQLVSAASSIWQNGANNGNKTLFSSRIKVKPWSEKDNLLKNIDSCIQKVFGEAQFEIPVAKKKAVTTRGQKHQKMLEVCLPDLHIGLSENEEGEGSIVQLEKNLAEKTEKICNLIATTDCNTVTLAFLGDILHYDTAYKTTTKGTQQCSNVSFERTFCSAVYSLENLIQSVFEELGKKYSFDEHSYTINVVYVPGNHDTILGYTVMSVLAAYFASNDFIKFDITQQDRKFTLFGSNLIGFIHGDMNPKRLNQWIYTDAKHWISMVNNIEIHCGHLHSEQVIEDNGMIVRHLPTICGVSPWERKQGYYSVRRLAAFLWDSNDGLNSIYYL